MYSISKFEIPGIPESWRLFNLLSECSVCIGIQAADQSKWSLALTSESSWHRNVKPFSSYSFLGSYNMSSSKSNITKLNPDSLSYTSFNTFFCSGVVVGPQDLSGTRKTAKGIHTARHFLRLSFIFWCLALLQLDLAIASQHRIIYHT